jgi:predicted amidohydrolase
MSRVITVAAAQLGPIARSESRADVVKRLLALLDQAHRRGSDLVVFPELALTTFFPRWWMENQAEIDTFFEREMPGPETRALFDEARRLRLAFCLGYAELSREGASLRRYNTSIIVDREGRLVGKYRKVHLPGHAEHEPARPFQHLEKRYFDVGDLGFPVWRALGGVIGMCICNDRRWPETYRVMGLQGVEMILLGYNTPTHNPPAPKCGREEGCDMTGQSAIIAPSGELVAQCAPLGDELITAACDLDLTRSYKDTIFNFARHRRPEHYRLIVERAGAVLPA